MSAFDSAANLSIATTLKSYLSATLYSFLGFDVTGVNPVTAPVAIDFSYMAAGGFAMSDADTVGLNFFSATLQQLTLPSLTIPLANLGIDLTHFTALQQLYCLSTANTPVKGDLRGLTALTNFTIAVALNVTPYVKIQLSAYPNLAAVSISGSHSYGITDIGTLGALRHLVSFTISSANVTQATINNILSTLNTAKAAGCPLTTVILTNTKAPTSGSSNSDYLALVAAGVSVTLGVL